MQFGNLQTNMLTTMVQCHTSCIITWQHPLSRKHCLSVTWGYTGKLCGLKMVPTVRILMVQLKIQPPSQNKIMFDSSDNLWKSDHV